MINPNLTLNQLTRSNNGANRLKTMIGAKDFVKNDNMIAFRFPMKTLNKANCIRITLSSMDLYDIEFGYVRAGKYTKRSKVENLYFDMLKNHFENETGLSLTL